MTTRVTLAFGPPIHHAHHPKMPIPDSLALFSNHCTRTYRLAQLDGLVTKAVTYQGDWGGCVTGSVSVVAHHLISLSKSGDLHIDHEGQTLKYMTSALEGEIFARPSVEYIMWYLLLRIYGPP